MSTNDEEKEKLLADIKECCRLISYSLAMNLDINDHASNNPFILRDDQYNTITTLNLVEISNLGSDFTELARLLEVAYEHK